MGLGVYRHKSVDHDLDLLRTGWASEIDTLDLLFAGSAVPEFTPGSPIGITISALPPAGPWTRLLVGRFALSCELLNADQLRDLRSDGRDVDARGVVRDPLQWRGHGAAGPVWELWNVYVRELQPWSEHLVASGDDE